MNTPAQRLKAARIAAGFKTATETAARFGWGHVTYIQHENGSRGLNVHNADRYAKAFGVSASWLLYGIDSQPKPSEPFIYDCMAGRFEFSGAP